MTHHRSYQIPLCRRKPAPTAEVDSGFSPGKRGGDAGLAELAETDHRICDEVSLVPTPGHTPGHVSVRIASRGEEALITGDCMHHPCQIARPEWSSTADSDPVEARLTRERMLTQLADTSILVIGTHFAGRTAGRIVRDGDAFRLVE